MSDERKQFNSLEEPSGQQDCEAVLDRYWESLRAGVHDPIVDDAPLDDEIRREMRCLKSLYIFREALKEDTRFDVSGSTAAGGRSLFEGGALLNQYRLIDFLGCGGMGEVYLAWHETLECLRAVKVLSERLSGATTAAGWFEKERKTLARISPHSNLVVAMDAGEKDGRSYLVMDYIPGTNLKEYVQKNGALPSEEACGLIRQAANGLGHAHDSGVIHRDIKPSNLLLADDGTVKILDLGLAKMVADGMPSGDWDATDPQMTLGTRNYMSPEQAIDPTRVDARSDLYSLGCTFYYLLAGHAPCSTRTMGERAPAHASDRPAPIDQLGPDVPAAVAVVVSKLIEKNPNDRYGSAGELIQEIDRASRTKRVRRQRNRTLLVAASLIALAVIGVGAGVWLALWDKRGDNTITRKPLAPALERLDLMLKRNFGQPDSHDDNQSLVSGGEESRLRPLAALGPHDVLRIEGQFREPQYWYLLWFDTAGIVTVEAHSEGPQTDIAFPSEPGYVTVDPQNPTGVHVLALVAGSATSRPGDEEQTWLSTSVKDVGQPPSEMPPSWSRRLRGAGQPVPADGQLPSQYLSSVQERLPGELQLVHAVFVRTTK